MNKKQLDHIKQNERRNKKLYDMPESSFGIDYILCPVLNIRKQNIKKFYIENILGITVDEFKKQFPDTPTKCSTFSSNMSNRLNQVQENGLTVHQNAMINATKTKNTVDPITGLTPNQMIGINSKKTHMANIDANGLNGYQRIAKGRNDTILDNGLSVQQNALLKRTGSVGRGASKPSKIAFSSIIEILEDNNIKYYFDKDEYTITYDNKNYQYDLTIPELNIVIEYQSNRYHPNPVWDKIKWDKWFNPFKKEQTTQEAYEHDLFKKKIIKETRDFDMFYIWEDSCEDDVESVKGIINDRLQR